MPTFQVLDGTRALFDKKYLNSPQIKKIVPTEMADWFKTKDGQWFAELLRKQIKLPDAVIAKASEKRMGQLGLTVNYLLKEKGKLLFGTDTPASPSYGNLPGWNGYLEMQQWAKAKVPLAVLLRSATLANAEAFGLDKDYGSIAVGKVGNLVLLAKNPLETVEAYDSISAVIVRGKVVQREKLAVE